MKWVLMLVIALSMAGCGSNPLQGQESSQEAGLEGGAEVAANDVETLSNTNTQVSSQSSSQEATQGSRVQADSVEAVETAITTNNGIVLTLPVIFGGLFVVLILGWLIPAPPWFSAIFGGNI